MSETPTAGFLVLRRLRPPYLVDRGGDVPRAMRYRGTGRLPVATWGPADDSRESRACRELFRIRADELGDARVVSALGWHPWMSSLDSARRVLHVANSEEPGAYEIAFAIGDPDPGTLPDHLGWRLAGYDVSEAQYPEHSLLAWVGFGLNAWSLQGDVSHPELGRLSAETLAFIRSDRHWMERFVGVYPLPCSGPEDRHTASICSTTNEFGLLSRSAAFDLLAVADHHEGWWLEPDWNYVVRSIWLPREEFDE